jgi:uncharacterized membrane protein YphA (DoxX/SURF4 family)
MLGSIAALCAWVELHVSETISPVEMLAGLMLRFTAGGGAMTVTVAVRVAVPPGPVAVRV